MLIVLSPAKSLDFSAPPVPVTASAPRLAEETAALSKVARRLKRGELARLMDLSDALAELNWKRFQDFDPQAGPDAGALPAALAFNGDVYKGLSARTLSVQDLEWAQDHVRILSGLYGVLRPLDAILPHRLEMGTRLRSRRGESLYDWWGPRIAKHLRIDLEGHVHPVVVNCASGEYFGAVQPKALKARVVTCHFKEVKDGQARVISFYAKHARGMMARWAIERRIDEPDALKGFDEAGYSYSAAASGPDDWVFARPQPPGKAG